VTPANRAGYLCSRDWRQGVAHRPLGKCATEFFSVT